MQVRTGEHAAAVEMLSELGGLLRETIDDTAPEVALDRELGVARRWLDIERVRFGDRLRVTWDVGPDCERARVPALVENALRHAELMRVLIVDDKPLARAGLRKMVAADRALAVVGEAASASAAREAIARLAPDIVLLDVEMPAENGFSAIAPDDELPVFVFVTAHAVHAVRAFEVRALDYVLKPFSDRRFAEAMARAKAAVAARRPQRIAVCDAGRGRR